MTHHDLETLLDFHYWARDRILDAVRLLPPDQLRKDLGSSFPSIWDTLVHLYSAEWAWHQRWVGSSPTAHIRPDQFPDLGALAAAWRAHEETMRAFLAGLGEAGIDRIFDYKNLAGQPGRSTFWQMLQHIVNHGSYHRGQVTTMLRQLGAAPGRSVDLIAYYREKG
jgi:uncharacterized damage-inducible protein DinB